MILFLLVTGIPIYLATNSGQIWDSTKTGVKKTVETAKEKIEEKRALEYNIKEYEASKATYLMKLYLRNITSF